VGETSGVRIWWKSASGRRDFLVALTSLGVILTGMQLLTTTPGLNSPLSISYVVAGFAIGLPLAWLAAVLSDRGRVLYFPIILCALGVGARLALFVFVPTKMSIEFVVGSAVRMGITFLVAGIATTALLLVAQFVAEQYQE